MKTIIGGNERGAVAPLVAILMVVFILCIALVVDLGHLHNVKVQLQRGVDAAALAGAQQLDGSAGQDARAGDVARATANANRIDNDSGWVTIDNLAIELGIWDTEITGAVPDDRFTPGGTPTNAIKVTATLQVDNIFFFLTDNSTVSADAIAVSTFEEQTIPIALVSCVPTGGASIQIKSPGLSVCDITSYRFHSDSEDTAAWTSLTFSPASQQKILEFLDDDGLRTFNQVVFGTGLTHDGIENTTVSTGSRLIPVPEPDIYDSTPRGCLDNNGTNINCGLGENFNVASLPPTDPLNYTPLPRWHMTIDSTETGEASSDAFTRLLTQAGHLLGDQTELADLYDPSTPPPPPFAANDRRFEKFITEQGGKYKPNFNEVLRYAGYPPVWVNNGTVLPALNAFLDDLIIDGTDRFRTFFSSDNYPFNEGNEENSGGSGYTVKLTIPVIFAGACDDWKAISNGPVKNDNTLFYVGTADFLLTRAWVTSDCYDHGDNAITISEPLPDDGDCGPISFLDYDPQITPDLRFQCAGGKKPNAAIEGVLRPPSLEGEETTTGILKVYLVE